MNGRALLCAGSERYAGAALMAALSALRGGAGVLSVCVPKGIREAFFQLPEAICIGCGRGGTWTRAALKQASLELTGKNAAALGPGMGNMVTDALLCEALDQKLPLALDADALNFLSGRPALYGKLHKNVVLTPHPGEMARLTGLAIAAVQAGPAAVAAEYAEKWGCTVVLKGADSYIAGQGRLAVNQTGNPGLAKGGSGDVLTGLILALLSQGLTPFDAACAGSYLLGCAADEAAALLNNRLLLARDVTSMIAQTREHVFTDTATACTREQSEREE